MINDWNRLDTRLFNIEMTWTADRGDKPYRDDLLFKTIDGNDISLDVIVSYRIDPAKASTIVQYVGTTNLEVKDKVASAEGSFKQAQIEADASYEKQQHPSISATASRGPRLADGSVDDAVRRRCEKKAGVVGRLDSGA